MRIIINLTDEEVRILESEMLDIQFYFNNYAKERIRKAREKIISLSPQHKKFNPAFLGEKEKEDMVKEIPLITIKDKEKNNG